MTLFLFKRALKHEKGKLVILMGMLFSSISLFAQLHTTHKTPLLYDDNYPHWDHSFENIKPSDTIQFNLWWPIAERRNDLDRRTRIAIGFAIAYLRSGDLQLQSEWDAKSKQLISLLPDSIRQIAYIRLGTSYHLYSHPIKAFDVLNIATTDTDEERYPEISLKLYERLSSTYYFLKDLQLSLEMAEKGLLLISSTPKLQKPEYVSLHLELLKEVALYHSAMNNYELAITYFEKAINLDHSMTDPVILAFLYTSAGQCHMTYGNYEESLKLLLTADSLNHVSQYGNPFTTLQLGYLYILKKDFSKGIKILEDELALDIEAGLASQVAECLNYLSIGYKEQGNYKRAYETGFRSKRIRDSLEVLTARQGGMNVLRNFINEQEKNKQLVLAKEKELAQMKASKAKNILLAVFLLLFLALLWGANLKKTKHKLQVSNLAIRDSEEKLRQANFAKNNLLAMIGHDLRAPLARSKSRISSLLVEKKRITHTQVFHELSDINQSLANLNELVNQLVNWAAHQKNKLVFTSTKTLIEDIIVKEINNLSDLAASKKVFIDIKCSNITILTDGRMLSFILRNFLLNAIKFSPEGESILIEAILKLEEEELKISVSDHGPGISPEKIKSIFEMETKFYPAKSQFPSYGLGLFLSNNFAMAMGGKITASSKEGIGSTFSLFLPFSRPFNDKEVQKRQPQETRNHVSVNT